MEAKYEEITVGETVCKRLKAIWHEPAKWEDCYQQVGTRLATLKFILRKFYCTESNVEVLQKAIKYTDQDIMDVFEQDVPHET